MSSLPRRSFSKMGTVNLTECCAGKFLLMLANLRTGGAKQAELSNNRCPVYWGCLRIIEIKWKLGLRYVFRRGSKATRGPREMQTGS